MAQAEDTELRDLVIEALERNGSLAKIRALLRANIFLAFEDECENMKQNVNLDNVLKLPEGLLALSVVHEFLEYCCLKNTLFVYMSESRQGNEYNYDGRKSLADKLNMRKDEALKEPLLLSLIKSFLNPHHKRINDRTNINLKTYDKCSDKNYREDQNCTYILHDSQSSNTSNSNSDNSSDEKNKLHLRLQLDHSDTDTSSDSVRDKSCSEYIPGDHILNANSNIKELNPLNTSGSVENIDTKSENKSATQNKPESQVKKEMKLSNSSSDSTSYIELKPFNSLDEKMLNTAGLPTVKEDVKNEDHSNIQSVTNPQNEVPSPKSGTLSSLTLGSLNTENEKKQRSNDNQSLLPTKYDEETSECSYRDDFSSSPIFHFQDISGRKGNQTEFDQANWEKSPNKNSLVESPHQFSQSSQSSVSISDVADLISEKSNLSNTNKKSRQSPTNHSKDPEDNKMNKLYSDHSGDFTESPVPSLSNLSLDIHSD
ncbi:unnamed protein product [Arctia plantaginis]|uniref:FGFR1 oncogene partner (FOP) N-terminal dimerisation domain-containing protein n=1 Tax=Arctia plantaginis TaxID=874455 RepID=A0A8S0ZTA4_ARCPL|nr:unnamed protein product [Arctia plantaginis]